MFNTTHDQPADFDLPSGSRDRQDAESLSGQSGERDVLQHYPTPDWLAAKAVALFKRSSGRLLDACSGAGALAAAWARRVNPRLSSVSGASWPIDAVELDARHHPALRAQRINVVGLDFLAFEGGAMYSNVVMNPPFAQGARFVLKAWHMMFSGEIVAIVNAETLRNPFSRNESTSCNLCRHMAKLSSSQTPSRE
jgi:predicted RNA methylase